jgi:hypothetical protein
MSKLIKNLVKISVAAATVGGLCYAFKDKIKESKPYQDYDVDTKLNKVKTTIKEKMPKVFDNEEDYVEDDEIFFEDEEFNPENSSRDYVSINLDQTSDTENAADETKDDASDEEKNDVSDETAGDVPTIDVLS